MLKSLFGFLREGHENYIIITVWVIIIIGGAIMSVVWVVEKATQSYYPLSTPKIHFFRYPHPPGLVEWVMEIDGSNKRIVFESDDEMIEKETKIYSPDSNIYLSTIPTMNDSDLFLHDYVNSKFVNMTIDIGKEEDFQFSPDGMSLLFMSDREGVWNIYKYDIPSGETKRLTNTKFGGKYPKFTPNGESLVYVQDRDHPDWSIYSSWDDLVLPNPSNEPKDPPTKKEHLGSYIYIMNGDGSDQKNLTPENPYSNNPIISPYGINILFSSLGTLYVMDMDGENVIQLTQHSEPFSSPSSPTFSPDGNRVIFNRRIRERSRKYRIDFETTKIFMVDVHGTGYVQLSSNGSDYDPFFYEGESLLKDKFIQISE
jgi:Tol biopolymer transport system component